MKKNLVMLVGASMLVLGTPTLKVSYAQASGPFADVPTDHWAYQSVDTLQKAGIVIGYPDGTYGGKRAMTRYEFAVAIARLMPLLGQGGGNFATKDDLAALRADLESKLAANQDAITALKKLVDEFGPELKKLGQDVAAALECCHNLEQRVAILEEEQRRVKIHGHVNIIGRADVAVNRDRNSGLFIPFVDKNGTVQGNVGSKHLLRESDVYHDVVLDITGKLSDTATANVLLDFGNFLNNVQDTAAAGFMRETGSADAENFTGAFSSSSPGDQMQTVWYAYLDAPISLGFLGGADAQIGRVPNQWTRYTIKQVDADVYTNLAQTDSGNIPIDGGKVSLKIGPARVQAFAGKESAIKFVTLFGGSEVPTFTSFQGRPTGQIGLNQAAAIRQGAGIRATFGAPEGAVLGVSVAQWGLATPTLFTSPNDPDRPALHYDKLSVYGADFNGTIPFLSSVLGGVTLDANWTVSAHGSGSGFNDVGNNWKYQSTDDQLGVVLGNLTLKGGYQYVGPYFSAPGYWGKIGAWTNPTNVAGAVGMAKYAFSPNLTLNAEVNSYEAAYDAIAGSPLQKDDKVNRYQIGIGYGLSSTYAVDLGYESVRYDLKNKNGTLLGTAGKPEETYTTFGIGHELNNNTSFKFLYQIVNYKDKGTGFGGPATGGRDQKGGIAVGQVSMRY